jgi:hypothetical protein
MNDAFSESRTELRSMLGITGSARRANGLWVPRSKLMRMALNPDNRAYFLAAAALATLVFPRISRAGALLPLIGKVATAGRHLANLRSR